MILIVCGYRVIAALINQLRARWSEAMAATPTHVANHTEVRLLARYVQTMEPFNHFRHVTEDFRHVTAHLNITFSVMEACD